ncbi:MAG: DUF294 nucleotidyltransferase-like domain-containing protein [Burkholderiales bacterium]
MSTTPDSGPAQPQLTPSASLLATLTQELLVFAPFSQMAATDVQTFLRACVQRYHAPGEVLLEPASGVVRELLLVRQGAVLGEPGLSERDGGAFQYEAGDMLPVNAAMAARPVATRYVALRDTFVLALPVHTMHQLAQSSVPFADFLSRRILQFLALSRQALQADYASRTLASQTLEASLGTLVRGKPVTCLPDTPLRQALLLMREQRVGSVLVTDASGALLGIFTRYDVLSRVALEQAPLERPIAQVMTQPVHALEADRSAHDAALLMSRLGIRHVPVTQGGALLGMVSERDLFAMQRQSLKQVSLTIQTARHADELPAAAQEIRQYAHSLLAQGVRARQITALVSHMNDLLTRRLLELTAATAGLNPARFCWLALGSEGRMEQTVSTDQDNALILADDMDDTEHARVLAWAHQVNLALDACGYPLCTGGIMAGNPPCCLRLAQWQARFAQWMAQGTPADLLNASIYFDFRPLWGDATLSHQLRHSVSATARETPRFLHQMALNALGHSAPLNWMGSIDTDAQGRIDVKLQGTAIFVAVARVYALAQGLSATNTCERLEAAGRAFGLADAEYTAWSGAFEFLQLLRLRLQLEAHDPEQPNTLPLATLNDIDRRILKEAFRFAKRLQQRLQLDYER